MTKVMFFHEKLVAYSHEASKACESCINSMKFYWQEVFIYSIIFTSVIYMVRWFSKYYFQKYTKKVQKEYDNEKRDWKRKKELTERLLEHLKDNNTPNNLYVEELRKLIGITNGRDSGSMSTNKLIAILKRFKFW